MMYENTEKIKLKSCCKLLSVKSNTLYVFIFRPNPALGEPRGVDGMRAKRWLYIAISR